jgi:hypothetical protein
MEQATWTIDDYTTASGESPVEHFFLDFRIEIK